MVYYVMAQHSELVLFLRERKSSSLACLFEDAEEVEENIRGSRRIQYWVCFENLHAYEKQGCQCIPNFEQEDNEYEAELNQQQECESISDMESDSSVFEDVSISRYACQVDDNF